MSLDNDLKFIIAFFVFLFSVYLASPQQKLKKNKEQTKRHTRTFKSHLQRNSYNQGNVVCSLPRFFLYLSPQQGKLQLQLQGSGVRCLHFASCSVLLFLCQKALYLDLCVTVNTLVQAVKNQLISFLDGIDSCLTLPLILKYL